MATNPQVRLVDSEDGRRLRVEVAGSGDRMILAQLGTPIAGVLFEPWGRDAGARGFTLVTYDRPGYGGSSSQRGRIVADCVKDVRTIASALGLRAARSGDSPEAARMRWRAAHWPPTWWRPWRRSARQLLPTRPAWTISLACPMRHDRTRRCSAPTAPLGNGSASSSARRHWR